MSTGIPLPGPAEWPEAYGVKPDDEDENSPAS